MVAQRFHREIEIASQLSHPNILPLHDWGEFSGLLYYVMPYVEGESLRGLTTAGVAVGTPAYMSPEQASGDSRIDHRSDIYALGVVFYEMLAGEPPYGGPTPQAILARQLSEEARPLAPLREVSPALERAIRKALARSAADRYSTALQFAAAVEAALGATDAAEPSRRRRARLRGIPLAAAAAAALLVGWWWIHAA